MAPSGMQSRLTQKHGTIISGLRITGIKPALVGLTGPWISGGIEFNWPQHHSPSTFEAVDHCIEEYCKISF